MKWNSAGTASLTVMSFAKARNASIDPLRQSHAYARENPALQPGAEGGLAGFPAKRLSGIRHAKASLEEPSPRTRPGFWLTMAAYLFMMLGTGRNALAQSAHVITSPPFPEQGNFWPLQQTNLPPLPFNPFPGLPLFVVTNDVYVIDDREVDYDLMAKEAAEKRAAEAAAAGYELECGSGGPPGPSYGSNDLWLEVTQVTNDFAYLTLHNASAGTTYQLQRKWDLNDAYWRPGEIIASQGGDTNYSPVPLFGQPKMFFRAMHSDTVVRIGLSEDGDIAIEPNTPGNDAGLFINLLALRNGTAATNLPVYYMVTGAAQNGVDYSNVTGVATIPAGDTYTLLEIRPVEDQVPEFDESVAVTLLANDYMVDTNAWFQQVTILDNPHQNFFTTVTNLTEPVGLDYSPVLKSLIVSLRSFGSASNNFVQINSNGVVSPFSGVNHLEDEVKLTVVHTTAAGFTNGQVFFGNNGQTNRIGLLSPDGTVSNLTFATLTNDTFIRGSLYVDQTGVFSNQLIAVTGNNPDQGGGVWRINSQGQATNLVTLTNTHLEGVITLPSEPLEWGPLAAKIITGAESATPKPLIFTINPKGIVETNSVGIAPEDFDLIPANQDLYCVIQDVGSIAKLSSALLTNYVGYLLVTQAGEIVGQSPKLFILQWDGEHLLISSISHSNRFEHVTFAPISIPSN